MRLFSNLEKKHYFLIIGWVIINILQSIFTDLHSDESYYWLYSTHLSWGFFDHPPMTAFLIYMGTLISYSELGVRLLFLVLSTLTLAALLNELNEKKDLLFLSIFALSFPLLHTHIAGFLALPDTPLVFFTLLFFLTYKKFLKSPSFLLSGALAMIAAAMIYSKYHAFLVLGFVVLSNLKLLKNKYFWTTIIIAIVLLIPHILWQFENEFPTFRYHLFERTKPLQFKYFFDNLISQVLVAGPLTGVIVFYHLKKFRIQNDPYKRALVFNIIGFYAFLTIMSFWNRIEAHYTVAITPLLMIASYPIISNNEKTKKWFKRLSVPIIVLFFMLRFYMAADFIPNVGALKLGFANRESTSIQIQELAKGKTVAFFNNYASPGMYEFYAKEKCLHLATIDYRFSQFDLWDDVLNGNNDSLFIVIPSRLDPTATSVLKNGKKVKYKSTPSFQSLKKTAIKCNNLTQKGSVIVTDIELVNNSDKNLFLEHETMPSIAFAQDKKEIQSSTLFELTNKKILEPNEHIAFSFEIPMESVDLNQQIVIFTKTNENNRGTLLPITTEQIQHALSKQMPTQP